MPLNLHLEYVSASNHDASEVENNPCKHAYHSITVKMIFSETDYCPNLDRFWGVCETR